MKTRIYRSVFGWQRDLVLNLEIMNDLLLKTIYFVAEKQKFNVLNLKNITIEISVKYVLDHEIQKYNAEYRKQNKPTNVLSFPILDYQKDLSNLKPNVNKKQIYLGDIVFGYQTIQRECKEQDKTVYNHLVHLFVHSILHLLGFDHIKKQDREEMESIEIELLNQLNICDIY